MKPRYWYRNDKNRYMNHTSQDVTLKTGYTVLQTRKGLSKAWIGYTIAKNRGEDEKLKYYPKIAKITDRCWNYKRTISGKISQYRY